MELNTPHQRDARPGVDYLFRESARWQVGSHLKQCKRSRDHSVAAAYFTVIVSHASRWEGKGAPASSSPTS